MPFFTLMPCWISDIVREEHFRPLEQLTMTFKTILQVSFRKSYSSNPPIRCASHRPEQRRSCTCSHQGRTGIFIGSVSLYNPRPRMSGVGRLWSLPTMKHGGFFDHVSPLSSERIPPARCALQYRVRYLGVRVPAFVISPFVKRKTVFNRLLDHTSILRFIGQKFGQRGSYSDLVNKRVVGSVLDVLDEQNLHPAPTVPSLVPYLAKQPGRAGFVPGTAPGTPIQKGFQNALDSIRTHPDKPAGKFDALLRHSHTATSALAMKRHRRYLILFFVVLALSGGCGVITPSHHQNGRLHTGGRCCDGWRSDGDTRGGPEGPNSYHLQRMGQRNTAT